MKKLSRHKATDGTQGHREEAKNGINCSKNIEFIQNSEEMQKTKRIEKAPGGIKTN